MDLWNEVHVRKLLEYLYVLIESIFFNNYANDDNTTRQLLLVTTSMYKPIHVDIDLEVSNVITWVVHSPLEIQIMITKPHKGETKTWDYFSQNTSFMFVAQD